MRIDFELLLRDAPGTLAPVLDRIAEHGGNILSVLHRHEAAEDGEVPVLIAVDVPEDAALTLVAALTRSNRILSIDREGGPEHTAVLLSGHVFQANLENLLEPVFAAGGRVERIDARIAGRDRPSAVWVDLSADDAKTLAAGLAALRNATEAAGIGVMTAVEEADG
jgi:ACT domain-containing protein